MGATEAGMQITFSDPLSKTSAEDPTNFTITTWDLKRSHNYGSKRYNVQELTIEAVQLAADGKTLRISLPEIQPTWVMEIKYRLQSDDGKPVEGAIQNTVYKLGKAGDQSI
jgi:hypothetical protein